MNFNNSSSDEEESKEMDGAGMRRSAHVGYDHNSNSIIGWDEIYEQINAEDEETRRLKEMLQEEINRHSNSKHINFYDRWNLSEFHNYEVVSYPE